ncbi:uncharacterized protein EV154DRAFT_525720 [Mucor mucedo]|uniref:uncharacterized protein n=1 Tax=Mucor mucedo TaxID=29922 RepID=UPI00221F1143|nr:uncharacterized protein EV154DRAFT_525720 [Mucor mucedo]KAI7876802.1 hypothetical protein EV154DRAFT_525720 [Mucor mucedo]
MILNAPLARVCNRSTTKVDGNQIHASARLVQDGISFTIYTSHPHFVYYLERNMTPQSYHEVTGSFSITTYLSPISGYPKYFIKVYPTRIAPVMMEKNQIPAGATAIEDGTPTNKMEFCVGLYVLQHWDSLCTAKGNRAEIAERVLQQFRLLVEAGTIVGTAASITPLHLDETFDTFSGIVKPKRFLRREKNVVFETAFPAIDFQNIANNMEPLTLDLTVKETEELSPPQEKQD